MFNVTKCKGLALTLLALSGVTALQAGAAEPRPEVLSDVLNHVTETRDQGLRPIVIIDLDDTLINTRERNLRIIRDFISQTDIQARFPGEVIRLKEIGQSEIRYLLADTLKAKEITDADFIKTAGDFWLSRFFTNEYCAQDQENPGASRYVQDLAARGATVVYLTGRDVPRMQQGTASNLQALGFPLDGEKAILMMKPDPKMDDLVFKTQAIEEIAGMGTLVGLFENEPANINLLHTRFPEAIAVFLDTIHSPKLDAPQDGITWVKDFHLPTFRHEVAFMSAWEKLSAEEAKLLACEEAAQVHFIFETICDEELKILSETRKKYTFRGGDVSGDCGIEITVYKYTGKVFSKVSCN